MTSTFVASTLAGVTIATALGLAAAALARKSRAASRHALLAAALGVAMLLPVFAAVMPPVRIAVPISISAGPVGSATEDLGPAEIDVPLLAPAESAAQLRPAPQFAWPSRSSMAFGVWLVGLFVLVAPVWAGLRQMRWLRRTALPWRRGQTIADSLASGARLRQRVAVLQHESIAGPVTCGIRRAVIVLPVDAETWSRADLDRALVHELEHVRRHDWLTQCVARALCACYWFHPLVWIARRQLALEAERACDDAVLTAAPGAGAAMEATAYADQLVGLAKRLSATARQPLLAMADRRDLSTRVHALLDSRQPRGRASAWWLCTLSVASLALVMALSPLRMVIAASEKPASGGVAKQSPARQKFEAVSIKPCSVDEPPRGANGGARSSQGGFPAISPGRFTIECGTVERLISNAYVLHGERLTNNVARIGDVSWWKGGPEWIRYDKYSIEASAPGVSDRDVLLGPMLRTLLEDRFKLQVHRETHEAPMYALTVAKGGLKIHPMGPGGCQDQDAAEIGDPRAAAAAVLAGTAKPSCGSMTMASTPGHSRWTIGGTTLSGFADTLSVWMDHHVIDRTGLPDTQFNIHLEFAPDEHVPGADKRNPRTEFEPADAPLIFAALEQQLGLKLEPIKGPQGVLVVDHIEKPTPNEFAGPPARAKGSGR
jgi:uncharacterized protein (TIGR03435 family)